MIAMTRGTTYKVRHRRFAGRVIDEMVAVYLGDNAYGECEFSLRPHAGTTTVRTESVASIEVTTDPVSMPVKSSDQESGR